MNALGIVQNLVIWYRWVGVVVELYDIEYTIIVPEYQTIELRVFLTVVVDDTNIIFDGQ